MIPKIVHYVWVGPRPFPEDARAAVEGWKRILGGYEFRFWTEENIDFTPRFVRQAYAVGAYNRVANYVRMAVLDRYGGLYLDHDVEVLKSFDPLLNDRCFAGFQTMDATATDIVNCAVLGAEPGAPLVREVLAALDEMNGADEVGSGTGPGLLSRVLRAQGDVAPCAEPFVFNGVTLYPPRYFYPYEWFEDFDPACVTPDTIAIHRWAHTWKRSPSLEARVRLKVRRLMTRLSPSLAAGWARLGNAWRRAAAAA